MNSRNARLAFVVVSPLVFFTALLVARRVVESPGDPTLYWDDDLRREVQAIVESRYVDPIDEHEARRLFHGAIQGYVEHLDPFSRFVPPEDTPRVEQETQGVFGGIGIRGVPVAGGFLVSAVREEAPAEKAGLEPGDVIERVDDEAVVGRSWEDMIARIRGEPGSEVKLEYRRDGVLHTAVAERAEVPLDTVPSARTIEGTPAVGYVRIDQFSDTTPAETRAAVDRVRAEGAQAIVLDLRMNLGGVVTAARDVAALFLPEDTIVCRSRRREGPHEYETESAPPPALLAIPMVVLVDETTASASEILAGAFQDHGRAVLVGARTWGKFLVQSLVTTSGGAMVRLTTARYETPHGRSAPRREDDSSSSGLVPDVRVTLTDEQRTAVRENFARQFGPRWRRLPATPDGAADPALDVAVALLRGGRPPAEAIAVREPRR